MLRLMPYYLLFIYLPLVDHVMPRAYTPENLKLTPVITISFIADASTRVQEYKTSTVQFCHSLWNQSIEILYTESKSKFYTM